MRIVQRDDLNSADISTSTEDSVNSYRDLCRQIYSQLPTTNIVEVLIET